MRIVADAQEIRFDNVYELFSFLKQLSAGVHYIFRGQQSADWPLTSSIERTIRRAFLIKNVPNREYHMLNEFKRRYGVYSSNSPALDNHVEWLALMQHHGCPTRLVDFSLSPYIALYFAVIDGEADSAVWVLNQRLLRIGARELFKFDYTEGETLRDKMNRFHVDQLNTLTGLESLQAAQDAPLAALLIEPENLSERMARQQGLFVAPTNLTYKELGLPAYDFAENLNTTLKTARPRKLDNEQEFLKIIIPHTQRVAIVQELNRMNINAETLFPGVDGMAKSLAQLVVMSI